MAEDHDFDTVEEALQIGVRLWDEQRYFEAHECLEAVWHAAPELDRDFWQGVIQVAVAGVHAQRGNPAGATALLDRAGSRLESYPERHRGVDVAALRSFCAEAAESLRQGLAGHDLRVPDFPASSDGPWFTPDPSLLEPPSQPTPVPEEPVWRTQGRPRQPRQRGDP